MNKKIDVPIPLDPDAAAALSTQANREAVGRLLSEALRAGPVTSALARAIADAKSVARQVGLTDADIDAELEAYNSERRHPPGGQ